MKAARISSNTKDQRAAARCAARGFLLATIGGADRLADQIDPMRRRHYSVDPILKALDGIVLTAKRALHEDGARSRLRREAKGAP